MNSDNTVRALTPHQGEVQVWPVSYPPYPAGSPPTLNHVPSLWDYWRILLRHKWTIATVVLVALIVGAIVSFSTTPLFDAVGRIVINREGDDAGVMKNAEVPGESDYDYMVAMDTQTRILESDAIAKLVIRRLDLDSNSVFAGKLAAQRSSTPDSATPETRYIEPHREASLVAKFSSSLQIDSIPRTRLLEIHFSSPDPNLAARVVNTLTDTYIEQNYKTHMAGTMRTSEWLSDQLSDLQLKVEESQEKLVRYQKEHGILGIDDKQNIITSKLDEMNQELTAAEGDRIQKESIYRLAISGDPELLSNLDPLSPLAKLRNQETDLHRQIAQSSVRFDSAYPEVQELNHQLRSVEDDIKTESARLASKYEKEYFAALEREKLLRAALEDQKGEANHLNESAIEYGVLKHDLDSNRQLYEDLLQKSKEAGVMTGLRSNNIRIVDPAAAPTSPYKPNLRHDLFFSLLAGLASGAVLAFALESRDNAVHSSEQVEMITALPSLAVIPALSRSKLARFSDTSLVRPAAVASVLRPQSEMAEAYRALRTSILLSRDGKAAKVLMITSALPQEGKTTTSVNLAVVLAQQGARVLLIEADLRRADISPVLGIDSETGLSSVLDRRASAQAAIRPVPGVPNLSILPAGPTVLYPSELLGSVRMKDLILGLRQDFDHIVIDTPPVLSVTDAVLLSAVADVTLLVTRAGTTSKAALRRVRDVLGQVDARLLGVVLNAVDLGQADRYYYGAYQQDRNYYHDSPRVEPAVRE